MNPGSFLLLEDLILFTLPGRSRPAGPAWIGAPAGDGKQSFCLGSTAQVPVSRGLHRLFPRVPSSHCLLAQSMSPGP